jgi:hypothetical protein
MSLPFCKARATVARRRQQQGGEEREGAFHGVCGLVKRVAAFTALGRRLVKS